MDFKFIRVSPSNKILLLIIEDNKGLPPMAKICVGVSPCGYPFSITNLIVY